jgi:hypothetical protein
MRVGRGKMSALQLEQLDDRSTDVHVRAGKVTRLIL